MKTVKKRINQHKSYEEQLKELHKEIELLNYLIPLRDYFLKIRKNQNSFVVEMRRLVMLELKDLGLNKSEIAKLFGKDHSTVLHLEKIESDEYVAKEVSMYYKDWIQLDLYPVSIAKSIPSYLHKTGWKVVRDYKLMNVNDAK